VSNTGGAEVYAGPNGQPAVGRPVGPGPAAGPNHEQDVMSGQTLQRVVTVTNPQGLHLRPAAAFAKAAREFQSTVTVRRDDRSVNGKSQLDLLLLAAEPGTQLLLEVSGADAPLALDALGGILEMVFEDDGAGDPPPKG
jgi:phosphocarrier protein HPr